MNTGQVAQKRKRVQINDARVNDEPPRKKTKVEKPEPKISRHLSFPKEEACLFNLTKDPSIDLVPICHRWIDSYKTDRLSAALELITFFLHSTGSTLKVPISKKTLLKFEAALTAKTVPEFFKQNLKCPSNMKPFTRKYSISRFIEFFKILYLQYQGAILYQKDLHKNVIIPLICFSFSSVFTLKFASTFVLIKLITLLEEVKTITKYTEESNEFQLESEKRGVPAEKCLARIQFLQNQNDEFEKSRTIIIDTITTIIKYFMPPQSLSVVNKNLINIWVDELELWQKACPPRLVSYLRFIFKNLKSTIPGVKLRCLKILLFVYDFAGFKNQLDEFNDEIEEGLLVIHCDEDPSIIIRGVKLMQAMFTNHTNILSMENYKTGYQLVFTKNKEVARELVKIFYDDDKLSPWRNPKSNESILNWLVTFFIDSEFPNRSADFVDIIFRDFECLQDWECMTRLLLEGDVNDNKIINLLKLMIPSIQHAEKEWNLLNVGNPCVSPNKVAFTKHFIVNLPLLFNKFKDISDLLQCLQVIPRYMSLDMYRSRSYQSKFNHLLDAIPPLGTDLSAIVTYIKMFEFIWEGVELGEIPKKTCNYSTCCKLIDQTETSMNSYMISSLRGTPPDDQIANTISEMKQLATSCNWHNMNDYSIFKSISGILKSSKDHWNHLWDGTIRIVELIYKFLRQKKDHLKFLEFLGDLENGEVVRLRQQLNGFFKDMNDIVKRKNQTTLKIRAEAFEFICNFLVEFRKPLYKETTSRISQICYELNKDDGMMLRNLMLKYVFAPDDVDYNELPDQKNILIAELPYQKKILAAFCKLITHNIFPIHQCIDIFKHYHSFRDIYGEILERTLQKVMKTESILSKEKRSIRKLLDIELANCKTHDVLSWELLIKYADSLSVPEGDEGDICEDSFKANDQNSEENSEKY